MILKNIASRGSCKIRQKATNSYFQSFIDVISIRPHIFGIVEILYSHGQRRMVWLPLLKAKPHTSLFQIFHKNFKTGYKISKISQNFKTGYKISNIYQVSTNFQNRVKISKISQNIKLDTTFQKFHKISKG